jgi:D-alanine-D-alanine ligase
MKIGIFMGGASREREISFAGGRTVYDTLDKSLFQPIPIFVDSFGHFIHLDWEWLYKGTIRDFYPPTNLIPESEAQFPIYIEQLGNKDSSEVRKAASKIGKIISLEDLPQLIDFAFLTLHGAFGEDGTLQGLLEWLGIPYSGSGIMGSAMGIDKLYQKNTLASHGFPSPVYVAVHRDELRDKPNVIQTYIEQHIGYPCVVKAPQQGSSIGLSFVRSSQELLPAIAQAFMRYTFLASEWNSFSEEEKIQKIRKMLDVREYPGLPARVVGTQNHWIHRPSELLDYLNEILQHQESITLEAQDSGTWVLVEKEIKGQEFSVIVLQSEKGFPIALPPTGIVKSQEVYDYRSKYLPGMARKITPIDLPEADIRRIQREAERLMQELGFSVYARIDGFFTSEGTILLNDPNTTSGMLPSSFFFHQAAELGLDPTGFLTLIIDASLRARIRESRISIPAEKKLLQLEHDLINKASKTQQRLPVAVILGGYSSERHISVESGRNIYEKLSSSKQYQPIPVFCMSIQALPAEAREAYALIPGCGYSLWQLPISFLLKDNADDIAEKISNHLTHPSTHPVVEEIRERNAHWFQRFVANPSVPHPVPLSTKTLSEKIGFAFIALHGRPGEDGQLQTIFESLQIPYNGSGPDSSRITIDKHATLEKLKSYGFSGAKQFLMHQDQWKQNSEQCLDKIYQSIGFPLIAKPADDGCSSAVKKINNPEQLESYVSTLFRSSPNITLEERKKMGLLPGEEFPNKSAVLLESLQTMDTEGDEKFLEVTVGLVTHWKDNKLVYEVFEPSETLAGKGILSLEEKFLAGEGQNITPARFDVPGHKGKEISRQVRKIIKQAAIRLGIEGYARIDAFVRIRKSGEIQVEFIEVNSLPGMTPATCIFHQCALNGYRPFDFIDEIIQQGLKRGEIKNNVSSELTYPA